MGTSLATPDKHLAHSIEDNFDAAFSAQLALKEKQIQQSYRPLIGIHKWFARRPGTLFRTLFLAEYATGETARDAYWHAHSFRGVIGDPFMGGGTPLFEANRLGFQVLGCDINPMAHWIVRQSLSVLDRKAFRYESEKVIEDVEKQIGGLYKTKCSCCNGEADVKYFLWVKTANCPSCDHQVDLFPGHLLAEDVRHPRNVVVCRACGTLNECEEIPTTEKPHKCSSCGKPVLIDGNVHRQKATCTKCDTVFPLTKNCAHPPEHRLWAIEYHCRKCYADIEGRQFKAPDAADIQNLKKAHDLLESLETELDLPTDEIPKGDESDRLHRWGYSKYRQMFSERQLVGLGLLRKRILKVKNVEVRWALLTVFSDTLRYQNLLCRYDTYALKCQDIFSIHGFPVGLIQCENNLLGIERVGSGSFRHFIEKYDRAKEYCEAPFEIRHNGRKKEIVTIEGESVRAEFVSQLPSVKASTKQAFLSNEPSQHVKLKRGSLDGVFTDPPYFDNVQYAELMDFCYVWLRPALAKEATLSSFKKSSTRSEFELTGNTTLGRGIEHFSQGIAEVFCHFAGALKPSAPFVFTYHHNDPFAYLPLVIGILDAKLLCTATLPAVGEMSASLHIAGTDSSVLDSVFVCRKAPIEAPSLFSQVMPTAAEQCTSALTRDKAEMERAGVVVTKGDLKCLLAGHIARLTISDLQADWNSTPAITERLKRARAHMSQITSAVNPSTLVDDLLSPSSAIPTEKPRNAT